jgi:uncharacterized protein YoxC
MSSVLKVFNNSKANSLNIDVGGRAETVDPLFSGSVAKIFQSVENRQRTFEGAAIRWSVAASGKNLDERRAGKC